MSLTREDERREVLRREVEGPKESWDQWHGEVIGDEEERRVDVDGRRPG